MSSETRVLGEPRGVQRLDARALGAKADSARPDMVAGLVLGGGSRGRRILGIALIVTLPLVAFGPAGANALFIVGVLAAPWMLTMLLRGRPGRAVIRLLALAAAVGIFDLFATAQPLRLAPAVDPVRILVCTSALLLLIRTFRIGYREVMVAVGLSVGTLWYLNYTSDPFAAKWKYALALPAGLVVLSGMRSRPGRMSIGGIALLIGLAAISATLAFRSMALEYLLTAGVVFVRSTKLTGRSRFFMAVGLACLAALFSLTVVPSLGRSGALGSKVQASFVKNSTVATDPVLAGRAELPIAIAAGMQSPIGGHGSLPIATSALLDRASRVSQSLGVNVSDADVRAWVNLGSGRVSAHSVLTETWITSGILGLVAGIGLMWLILKGLKSVILQSGAVSIGVIFLLIDGAWDLFFSPMITGRDILFAMIIIAACCEIARRETSVLQSRASQQPIKAP